MQRRCLLATECLALDGTLAELPLFRQTDRDGLLAISDQWSLGRATMKLPMLPLVHHPCHVFRHQLFNDRSMS